MQLPDGAASKRRLPVQLLLGASLTLVARRARMQPCKPLVPKRDPARECYERHGARAAAGHCWDTPCCDGAAEGSPASRHAACRAAVGGHRQWRRPAVRGSQREVGPQRCGWWPGGAEVGVRLPLGRQIQVDVYVRRHACLQHHDRVAERAATAMQRSWLQRLDQRTSQHLASEAGDYRAYLYRHRDTYRSVETYLRRVQVSEQVGADGPAPAQPQQALEPPGRATPPRVTHPATRSCSPGLPGSCCCCIAQGSARALPRLAQPRRPARPSAAAPTTTTAATTAPSTAASCAAAWPLGRWRRWC